MTFFEIYRSDVVFIIRFLLCDYCTIEILFRGSLTYFRQWARKWIKLKFLKGRGRGTGASPEFRGLTTEKFLASWIYEGGSFSYLTGKKLVPRPLTLYICSPRDPFETPWLEEFFLLNQLGISDFEVFQCKCNLRNKIVG